MARFSLSFKNCRYSKALEEIARAQFEDSTSMVHATGIRAVHLTVSEENGVYTPGPDVFQCVLVAAFASGPNLRLEAQEASAYDAVDRVFAMLRRAVLERKRRRVQQRNDLRENVFRGKVAGGRS